METINLNNTITRQLFKTAWIGSDLKKTEMSYRQAPNCNMGCRWKLHMNKKEHVLKNIKFKIIKRAKTCFHAGVVFR